MATIYQDFDNDYHIHAPLWQQVRAVCKGKYAVNSIVSLLPQPQYSDCLVREGATEAAIKHAARINAQNANRIKEYWARGRFFNATGQTKESLTGMVWSKAPEVEISSRLSYLEEDNYLTKIAQKTVDELLQTGRYGLLVDMPEMPVNEKGEPRSLTQAETESGDFAPRIYQYKAEQIKSFVYDREVLLEVCLQETYKERKGDTWQDVKYERKLVLEDGVYHNKLYDEGKKLISDVIPTVNGSPSNEVLFQFVGADDNTPLYSKVPLYDLANQNLGHYVLDCDNRDNLHYHGQGMTNVFTEMDVDEFFQRNPNGLNVGAKGSNQLRANDKVELLQLEATGAIATEMERDEQRMIYLGAQLVKDSTNQTLGAKVIETNANTSVLKRIVNNASDAIEQCVMWCGEFLGFTEGQKYRINTDFITDEMDAQKLAQHFAAIQGGILPIETYYESARKAGLTKLDNEEIAELAEQSNLDTAGQSEEMATLQAELEAAREELAQLRGE